jgi:hypothetical protein
MAVNSTHPDYDANLATWLRARDVFSGEDAVKAAGEKYLPRLDSQTPDEFASYVARASFFNATARTADGYAGLIFRRPPFVKVPSGKNGLGAALDAFLNEVDMLGTPLQGYAKNVVQEVLAVGRAGSLIDWEGDVEDRAYATLYSAENILNWRVERVNGRCLPTLIVLQETAQALPDHPNLALDPAPALALPGSADDPFATATVEQIRVLKLVPGEPVNGTKKRPYFCQVEVWRRAAKESDREKPEWVLVERRTPLRRGKPLPLLPFVFHGPRHSLPAVDRLPLGDIIFVNLDHYRLNADFKHGVHFTALPTAWVSGFPNTAELAIGSRTAWVSETVGATAGFLEFKGQGLATFETAMDRDERLMSVLGSRLIAEEKRVAETAATMEMRQAGEHSILGNIANSISESLTQILRWVYWWNSTEDLPDSISENEVSVSLNTDYSTRGMAANEVVAVVKAWQAGALSTDSMQEVFRRGDVLPNARSNEEEQALLARSKHPVGQASRLSP